jgi:23S rRNA pseudouridine1911/1915/1917 synthase
LNLDGEVKLAMRLDKRVAEQFSLSRRRADSAVRHGQVDVEGQTCFDPAREVEPDTPLDFKPGRPRPETTARRLKVLYEDRDILIIDKPAGLLTQPTPDRERDTLLERAGRYLTQKRGLASPYVGIVHRIDKLTTGVILLVCSPRALRPFQSLFRAHAIERSYLAVVDGLVEPGKGTIDLPLTADRGDGRRGAAWDDQVGVPAITHYESIEQFGLRASLLTCRLETGRTHQIRIHLAEIKHPVVGDPIYGRIGPRRFHIPFPRQALHAQALGFVHPITGQALRIEAPLPTDMKDLIAGLRERFGSQK